MFWKRTLSGAVLLIASFVLIYFGGVYLKASTCILALIAFFELTRALKVNGKEYPITYFGYFSILIFYVLMIFGMPGVVLFSEVIISLMIFLSIFVAKYPKYKTDEIVKIIFSYVYAPLFLSFIPLTRDLNDGFYIVWMIYICSWGYDTFAYCVGMTFGKTVGNHKAFPVLSPKKSIEGIIGGLIGAMLLGFLYGTFVLPEYRLIFTLMALPGGLLAQMGDLSASAIKRDYGIKDYSHVIPGHGGIMDRFDSVIFTAPVIYLLALIML